MLWDKAALPAHVSRLQDPKSNEAGGRALTLSVGTNTVTLSWGLLKVLERPRKSTACLMRE
jgi:hypothetical protein